MKVRRLGEGFQILDLRSPFKKRISPISSTVKAKAHETLQSSRTPAPQLSSIPKCFLATPPWNHQGSWSLKCKHISSQIPLHPQAPFWRPIPDMLQGSCFTCFKPLHKCHLLRVASLDHICFNTSRPTPSPLSCPCFTFSLHLSASKYYRIYLFTRFRVSVSAQLYIHKGRTFVCLATEAWVPSWEATLHRYPKGWLDPSVVQSERGIVFLQDLQHYGYNSEQWASHWKQKMTLSKLKIFTAAPFDLLTGLPVHSVFLPLEILNFLENPKLNAFFSQGNFNHCGNSRDASTEKANQLFFYCVAAKISFFFSLAFSLALISCTTFTVQGWGNPSAIQCPPADSAKNLS